MVCCFVVVCLLLLVVYNLSIAVLELFMFVVCCVLCVLFGCLLLLVDFWLAMRCAEFAAGWLLLVVGCVWRVRVCCACVAVRC